MIGELNQGRYLLEAELGRGGMGVVYRARDTLLDRFVAIKVVSAGRLGSEAQERLMLEARAAARLNHPNIVAVYDVGREQLPGQSEVTSYIVMELVEGESLREHQIHSLEESIAIGRQIGAALEQAHERGIIHRDLKPENVLLAPEPGDEPPLKAKLVDFGLARVTGRSRLTQEGALVGTLSYMAPEVILGEEASPSTDLYALGVILYELVAGRPPFEGGTATAILSQHLHAPVVPPSAFNDRIPPSLDDLAVRMLRKQPEERLASAAEVRRRLASIAMPEHPIPPQIDALQLKRLVRGRLVGREAELSQATLLWERAATGDGQVLLVSGEPGIGKSRLLQELATYAEIRGAVVLSGTCYERGAVPYMPISQILRFALSNDLSPELPPDSVVTLAGSAPELAIPGAGQAASPQSDLEGGFAQMMEGVVAFLLALERPASAASSSSLADSEARSPILIFIDDLHWADSGTLAVIRYLARRLREQPVLIVGAYREVELDQSKPLAELLADLEREGSATRIKLHRLSKEHVRRMLTTLFAEETTPDFVDAIYKETEGNPFFTEEICKALIESGDLQFKDGRWQRPEMDRLRLPQSVRSAIQPRIGMLTEQRRETLTLAALLGREFRYEMLRVVSDQDELDLIATLESAERVELIREAPGGAGASGIGADPLFRFTHALVHSTLLSDLGTLRRLQMQREVALRLEAAYPERRNELAPLLGRYFAEAHDVDRAITYLLHAADYARELYAFDEAIAAYNQALLFLREEVDTAQTAGTLMKVAMLYHSTFAFKEARVAFEEAFVARQSMAEARDELEAEHPPAPHALRLNFANPVTLDSAKVVDSFSVALLDQLFSGLLQRGVDGEIIPDVARSWKILENGQRYLFSLRDDVRWSDGRPVTAADFEVGWKRLLAGPVGEQPAILLYDIRGGQSYNEGRGSAESVGVKARGDWELEVVMERPTGYFLELLANSLTSPVPAHVVRAYGDAWSEDENLVTNGPFKLIGWERGNWLLLERNPTYHGNFGGNALRVKLHFDSVESENLIHKYDAGELDVYYPNFAVSSAYDWARLRHPTEYMSIPALGTYYLGFNVNRPPFDDRRVRRAFALALEREKLADSSLKGIDFPATGGFTPPGLHGHVTHSGLKYDPLAARGLMSEAGFDGGKGFPEEKILTGDAYDFLPYFEAMRDQLEENLGIRVGLQQLPFAELLVRLRDENPTLWFISWGADYPDADNFLRVASWRDIGGWHNNHYHDLVERGRRTLDQGARLELYRQAEELITQETPIIPLLYSRYHIVIKPWVTRFPVSPKDVTMWKEVVIQPH